MKTVTTAALQHYLPIRCGGALRSTGQANLLTAVDAFAQVKSAESYYDQGNALAHLDKLEEAAASYKQALKLRSDWQQAEDNLAIIEKILGDRKKHDEEQEEPPNLDPDQIQFDDKGKQGKEGQIDLAQQTADMWMKNIQVTPTDLLARKFALEAKPEQP